MSPNTTQIFRGTDEINAAILRGEELVEITPEEADEIDKIPLSEKERRKARARQLLGNRR